MPPRSASWLPSKDAGVTGPASVPARNRRRYCQDGKSVGEARRAVMAFARACGFVGQVLSDIEVAVGEALANAVEHGGRGAGHFDVRTSGDARALTIEITDSGDGFDHARALAIVRPPSDALRGFGMFIMRELMDEIEYSERGRRVRLVKYFPPEVAKKSLEHG